MHLFLDVAVKTLQDLPDLPANVISVEEVDEIVKERDHMIGVLNLDIQSLQKELDVHTQTIASQDHQIKSLTKVRTDQMCCYCEDVLFCQWPKVWYMFV